MQKIKLSVIDTMIKENVTNAEIVFIIYISKYQDDSGKVQGVYYKDVCAALNISYQKFYDLKQSLIIKELINVEKNYYADWDITILNNDFTDGDFSGGYISTNMEIFQSDAFAKLKAKEKMLAIHFLKIYGAGERSFKIKPKNFFNTYCEKFSVTKRIMRYYLTNLKTLFSIGIKQGLYYITPLKAAIKASQELDITIYEKYSLTAMLRRLKIKVGKQDQEFKDTLALLKQYAKKNANIDMLHIAIVKSLMMLNKDIHNQNRWKKLLQPKLVHQIFREMLI